MQSRYLIWPSVVSLFRVEFWVGEIKLLCCVKVEKFGGPPSLLASFPSMLLTQAIEREE